MNAHLIFGSYEGVFPVQIVVNLVSFSGEQLEELSILPPFSYPTISIFKQTTKYCDVKILRSFGDVNSFFKRAHNN